MGFVKPRAPVRRNLLHVYSGPSRGHTSKFGRARYVRHLGISRLGARRARRSHNMRIPTELKYYDTKLIQGSLSQETDATGGEENPSSTSMMTTPVVGDGEQDRDGKHIIVKSIHIIGNVEYPVVANLTVANQPATGFVCLVQDTNSSGAQLNSEDVWTNILASGVTNNDLHRNLLFGKRFKVLKMFRYNMMPTTFWDGTNTEVMGVKRRFEWWLPSVNMHVNFNAGTTASIANVVDNSLQMVGFCSVNAGQQAALLSYTSRIRFVG